MPGAAPPPPRPPPPRGGGGGEALSRGGRRATCGALVCAPPAHVEWGPAACARASKEAEEQASSSIASRRGADAIVCFAGGEGRAPGSGLIASGFSAHAPRRAAGSWAGGWRSPGGGRRACAIDWMAGGEGRERECGRERGTTTTRRSKQSKRCSVRPSRAALPCAHAPAEARGTDAQAQARALPPHAATRGGAKRRARAQESRARGEPTPPPFVLQPEQARHTHRYSYTSSKYFSLYWMDAAAIAIARCARTRSRWGGEGRARGGQSGASRRRALLLSFVGSCRSGFECGHASSWFARASSRR